MGTGEVATLDNKKGERSAHMSDGAKVVVVVVAAHHAEMGNQAAGSSPR